MEEKNNLSYDKINPEEIILKLKTIIKFLEEKNGRNEREVSSNSSD